MMSSILETAVDEDDLIESILMKEFGGEFKALCSDKVVGVRLQISQAFANMFEKFNKLDDQTRALR